MKLSRSKDQSCLVIYRGQPSSADEQVLVYPAIGSHHVEKPPRNLNPIQLNWRQTEIVELTTASEERLRVLSKKYCKSVVETQYRTMKDENQEVRKLIDNGNPENRIDVVLMGDGYTLSEKSKFFKDMQDIVDDMWSDTTFSSYRPLFNVWAVFVPSKQSGIGTNGKAKDTAFGLYRDGTELRGIYCSKPAQAREVCKLTGSGGCDFPSIIGNDQFYGGLGSSWIPF